MKITLSQKEIEQALVDFVGGQGISISGRNIHVELISDAKELTAAIDISSESPQRISAPPVDFAPLSQSTPQPASVQEPVQSAPEKEQEPVEEPDRERIKAELDRLDVEYAPKAHTPTLQALLEEALAKSKEEAKPEPKEEQEEQGSLFGSGASVPASTEQPFGSDDDAPFDTSSEEKSEEGEDERPLFGR